MYQTAEQEVLKVIVESVLNDVVSPAFEGLINETEEEENYEDILVESIFEYIYDSVVDIAESLLPSVLESIQDAQTEEEVEAIINEAITLAEMYATGVLNGIQPLIYEFRIPDKIKKVLKYVGIGALGAGALAGAAYAGAHADQIGQHLSHAKDVVQQKIHSLIQHLRGGAEHVTQHAQQAAHHASQHVHNAIHNVAQHTVR